jgi:hypothetical protein
MSRQDIADYLGLIETISRTLTSLESCAAIEVPSSRRIVLRNRSALNRMTEFVPRAPRIAPEYDRSSTLLLVCTLRVRAYPTVHVQPT